MNRIVNRGGQPDRAARFSPKPGILKFALSIGMLSAVALSGGVAFAEDRYPLSSIDFVSQGSNTGILFHTGSHVPYRTILASDNKIVIDVDGVQAEQTVKTNFADAENISHVVLQPLSKNTIRLIVRGEHLGTPKVAFKDASVANELNNRYSNSSQTDPFAETRLASKPSADTFESAANKPVSTVGEVGGLTSEEPANSFEKPAVLNSDTPAPKGESTALPKEEGLEAGFHSAVNREAEAPTPLNLSDSDIPPIKGLDTGKSTSDFFGQLPGFDWAEILKFGGLGAVLLGFGAFIRNKYISLSRRNQELYYDDGRNKRQNFRSLADEYQLSGPKQGKNGQKAPAAGDGPIGLRALQSYLPQDEFSGDFMEEPPQQQQPVGPTLPPFMGSGRKNNAPAAPKKQLINQYAQQQSNVPPAGRPRQRISDDMLRQEVQRSAEIKRQTEQFIPPPGANRQKAANAASVIRKTAASTAPKRPGNLGKGGALPPNPEVLNFLRSVADLMDKDGKPPAGKPNPAQRRR